MAHELGHVFNMLHDSNFKCQSDIVAGKYAVMAPTLNYHSSPWKWSKCSRNQLTEFLDLGYGECLLDKPTGPRSLPVSHPGEVYNITQQCELVFGTGSTLCTYMTETPKRTCKRLWCTGYSRGVQTGCRTQHMPWADGTPCGSHHWCSHGECREKEQHTEVIDGQWGKWGEYSECSRTCGGGVKEAMRNCDNPAPGNGGKYCIGRRLRFRSCSTQDCPEGSQDFREKQCSEFNGSNPPINGVPPNVRWVPKYEGVQLHDRCKLYCRVSHSSAYYELKKKVRDGTKCDPDNDDICVQGQCRQAGCDHVLSSNAKRDECGVCGGDNSACRRERRTYNHVRHGYTKIITIPSGSTQIEIKQYSFNGRAEDDNYLALSNDQDQFILNGNFIVSMYAREIHINKTVLQYSGSSRAVETIISNDKIQRAINLYILSVGDLNPPNVSYSFNVPHTNFPIYLWDRSGPWTECDRDCYGMKRRVIRCMDANDNRVVDDSMCEGPRPTDPIEEECNTRCIVRWHVMRESECNEQCKKTRLIKCIKKKRKGEEYSQVTDVYCNAAERPPETIDCQDSCRTSRYRWEYSLWSQCSRSCNTGTRSRGASCRYGEGYIVDNRYCDHSLLHTVEDCSTHGCPEWSALEWSACSVTCGVGEELREVACYQEGTKVDSRLCDSLTKPDARQRCEQKRCPHWAPGQWESCSVTCGSGYQRRTVGCRTFDGQWLDESECSAGAKPIVEQECKLPDCPIPTTTTVAPTTTQATTPPSREIITMPVFDEIVDRGNPGISPAARRRIFRSQWRTGAWTPCSMTCGPGIRERYVSCRDGYGNIDNTDCDPDLRPLSMEMCELKSCPHWRTGDWRECPVSCGEGVTTRYVACVYNDDTITSNAECDPEIKPSREHSCNGQDCPTNRPRGRTLHDNYDNRIGARHSWRTSTWSPCSVSCGEGSRQRRVECLDDNNRISSYCDQTSRPTEAESCEVEPCPSWDYGEWGQCSRTCDGGVQSRVVKCRRRNGQTVSDSRCDHRKPENSTTCNTQRCRPRWHTGTYSSCSVTCDKGLKTRIVVCQYEDGSLAVDSECEGEEKPPTERECRKPSCAKWKSGDWGECSVTCGRGTQEREVVCASNNQEVNSSLCPGELPRTSKSCRRNSCPSYRWKKGRWTQCNETCGGGLKLREVWCQDNKGRRVTDEYCQATRKKPTHMRKCNVDPCPPRYITGAFWVEGLWEECTRTCGAGEQIREITCQELSEDGWRIPSDLSTCNPATKPESTRRCNMGTCFGDVHWKIGPWATCSKSCGDGVQRRKVQCQARHGKIMPDRFCRHPAIKPETERICNSRACPPTSCRDLQEIQNIQEDGDYSMLIQGRLLQIFCHGMAGSNPAEYLTLPASEAENYSEIYTKRLLNPSYCPNNGARNDDCECSNYGHRYPGLTSFNKIRINVTTLEVITDDPTFATVHHGHFIPYATAGDCFSVVPCPQGRFHVSLNGTGLVVAPDVDWSTEGHSVSRQISRDAINQRVSGICGGYCGKCFPDRGDGRLLPLTFQS
ncbi:A disintegrin and metalloproteinase with thrombospondin motifs 9 [Strongylocentrotus purpuratus]|uniref:A disintegrin and metalloproteinase with thrombospondin motifs 9 n=1 Tax=Strongylocentrotus purpuratus TaxID=7668 RepID=A0A7M7MYB5_STRPU|nr:A disintegrin and metalloproteinase with thrombospondin motifs 9 [Strongylocentrotus purpuratus]